MAKTDWYTFAKDPTDPEEGYIAVKYDKNFEPVGRYKLNKRGTSCDCPAHVPFCRHKKMLAIFIDMDRIGTGHRYNVDRDEWLEPEIIDDLEM